VNNRRTVSISPQEVLELEVRVPAYSMRSYALEKNIADKE